MTMIDLTHTISDKMEVFDGDPAVALQQIATIEKDGFQNYRLSMGMHTSTHIDGPLHLMPHGNQINELSINHFIGEGYLINLVHQSAAETIEKIKNLPLKDKIVLVYTGYSKNFGTPQYYSQYPSLDSAIAELLVEKEVKMVGLDTPSPDYAPFSIHQLLLSHNILIAENVANLQQLIQYPFFTIVALPLKIAADSSPARIIAIVNTASNED
jgi:kynurenine formamidase